MARRLEDYFAEGIDRWNMHARAFLHEVCFLSGRVKEVDPDDLVRKALLALIVESTLGISINAEHDETSKRQEGSARDHLGARVREDMTA